MTTALVRRPDRWLPKRSESGVTPVGYARCQVTDLLDSDSFYDLANQVLAAADLGDLTDESRAIVGVRPTDRALKVVAGPGSGKTEMLVWRVLYEAFVNQTAPDSILVTTFTRKAATELEIRLAERLDQLVAAASNAGFALVLPRLQDVRIGTIHALCDRLLSEHDQGWLEAGTRLVDEFEAKLHLRRAMPFRLGYGRRGGPANDLLAVEPLSSLFTAPWEGPPVQLFDKMAVLDGILAQHVETWVPRCAESGRLNGAEAAISVAGLTDTMIELHERWRRYLDEQDIIDFANIQNVLLERQAVVAPTVQHALVDEFQDTNPIQLRLHLGWLLNSAARTDSRLTVVGDEDQSLYRFRGSDIGCFTGFENELARHGIDTRIERLETNYRSTARIVRFAQAYRVESNLAALAGDKRLRAAADSDVGDPPRLISGPWSDICDFVGDEVLAHQTARETVAVLLFSTSEARQSPTLALRLALEGRGMRVYNPRNKTAHASPSPIHDLLGFISYFFDPVVLRPVGKNGRNVEVAASMSEDRNSGAAPTVTPDFRPPSPHHLACQKKLRKRDAAVRSVGNEVPDVAEILDFLDDVRRDIVAACAAAGEAETRGEKPRWPVLTSAGLVARILKFKHFRECGYTMNLFRQAAFTEILESAVATTRRTMSSLDAPLRAHVSGGKVVWDQRYWDFLNGFGTLLKEPLDDQEVEAFEDAAVPLITFHQAKGLEFAHVIVGLTGRQPAVENALRTALFSGDAPNVTYDSSDGSISTTDAEMIALAEADKAREIFVAVTRAKRSLTIIHDPDEDHPLGSLDPHLAMMFASGVSRAIDGFPTLDEITWQEVVE